MKMVGELKYEVIQLQSKRKINKLNNYMKLDLTRSILSEKSTSKIYMWNKLGQNTRSYIKIFQKMNWNQIGKS